MKHLFLILAITGLLISCSGSSSTTTQEPEIQNEEGMAMDSISEDGMDEMGMMNDSTEMDESDEVESTDSDGGENGE